jgi:hypothetical protein
MNLLFHIVTLSLRLKSFGVEFNANISILKHCNEEIQLFF